MEQLSDVLATAQAAAGELTGKAADLAAPYLEPITSSPQYATAVSYYEAAKPTLVQIEPTEWAAIIVTVLPAIFAFFALIGMFLRTIGLCRPSHVKIAPTPPPARAPLPKKGSPPPPGKKPPAGAAPPRGAPPRGAPPPGKGTPGTKKKPGGLNA